MGITFIFMFLSFLILWQGLSTLFSIFFIFGVSTLFGSLIKFQIIQFSISIVPFFFYKRLNVRTVLLLYSHIINMHIYIYTCRIQQRNDNDDKAMKTSDTVLRKLYLLTLFERFVRVRGSWRLNKDCNILTPTLMAISVVPFSFSRAAQPEAWGPTLLGADFLYRIFSLTHLISNYLTSCPHRVI